jgi:GNAT superfamily N-acetyltransferase
MDERATTRPVDPRSTEPLVTAHGRLLVVRPARPDDVDVVRGLIEHMPDEHRQLRFLQPVPVVHDALVRPLVAVDQQDHLAWLAFDGAACIAEARLVRDPHRPDRAEVAFAVLPAEQRQGVARALVEVLGVVGRHAGLRSMTALVAAQNHRSASFLRSLDMRFRWTDGELEGEGPLPAWSGSAAHAARLVQLHRRVAATALAAAA